MLLKVFGLATFDVWSGIFLAVDVCVSFQPSYRLLFMHPSPIRVTNVPGDVIGVLSGEVVAGIAISTFSIARFRLCLKVSDDVLYHLLMVCDKFRIILFVPVPALVAIVLLTTR